MRLRQSPSPTWKAFLNNHVRDLVSIDFFVVPTIRFRVLFVLVILAHHRRRVVHFNATAPPRPPSGKLSRSFKLLPGIRRRSIYCGIEMASMGFDSKSACRHGRRRGSYSAAKPLAECFCGSRDWQHPAGLPRSCHRIERLSSEMNPGQQFPLLSSLAHASVIGDGHPRIASNAAIGTWKGNRVTGGRCLRHHYERLAA